MTASLLGGRSVTRESAAWFKLLLWVEADRQKGGPATAPATIEEIDRSQRLQDVDMLRMVCAQLVNLAVGLLIRDEADYGGDARDFISIRLNTMGEMYQEATGRPAFGPEAGR